MCPPTFDYDSRTVHLRYVGHLPALWGVRTPTDFDDSIGRLVCTNCGHVVNDSFIVSEISFGESYVAEGQTHAGGGGGGRFRSGNSLESQELLIQNGEFVLFFVLLLPYAAPNISLFFLD